MSTPPFLTLPASARSVRLTTARGGFAALRSSPSAGPVRGTALLLPGFTGSKEDFIALLEPLAAAGFEVVAVDQRGQYQTGGPDEDAAYTLGALALDLRAVTDAVGGGRPLHLLGHSFGGYVVREALLRAAADSDRLPWDSLTLMSTGPGAVCPDEAGRAELLVSVLPPVMELEAVWQAMRQMEQQAGTLPVTTPEVTDFLHRRWLANVPAALRVTGRQLTVEPDRVEALAGVALPKLVLSGERDYAWPVEEQQKMAQRLGAGYAAVPGAGHSPNAEQPARTAAELVDFWLSVS
ncbi:alpha/beta fold hydrolase [Streptacidiphilus sp. PB12-B1b]|uniref:alpha/beta fold hydrolase n=1 Tax=Streptacidiphilus sp. PB12-B1b TaxID=2705012 RepID=UPI0015FD9F8A|nr:alpha/beta fold hydrolase [Streptacidiphilus sp. PB12-B1b]QMU75208.1 alpha/beta fold hydrolase [Streptacidiphilus sp. PB12-B1b]